MKNFFQKKSPLNYLYFIFLFLCLFSLSFIRELPLNLSPLFIAHLLAQSLLEVTFFALIAHLLKGKVPKIIYFALLSFFFALMMVHFTNFILLKLMDVRLTYLLNFFAGHGFLHIITVFQAINMNQTMLVFIGISLLCVPVIGIGIYQFLHLFSKKQTLQVSHFQILSALTLITSFLLIFEWVEIRNMPYAIYAKYQKTTPLGETFLSPSLPHRSLEKPLSLPYDPKEMLEAQILSSSQHKPNIYLFIIETFRDDFICEAIAPHLTLFGKENIRIPHSYANANCTQTSWFAIFHSLFPYHWTEWSKTSHKGSVPLHLLKNLGYKIHVYSSADLRYFDMDTEIFGPNRMLADTICEYAPDRSIESWQKDALVMKSFENELQTEGGKEGNLYLFFLDAPHSEYSFPLDLPYTFTPIVDQIDYLSLSLENLEPIKNRYRNAIHYVDTLMDRFFSLLKKENIYEQGIIAITGDHGEEFFEEGSLFHGTHLNREQTNVPILFKFPANDLTLQTDTATHVDIFPSIFHFLNQEKYLGFDGQSIFYPPRWPYRLAILQNGAKTPEEFTIENEYFKLRARFVNPEKLYTEKGLEILSLTSTTSDDLEEVFQFLTRRSPEQISRK